MRNLKRALSLALASVMVLGLMVVGSGASYKDVSSENNQEAIEVLQAVGVMVGDDNGNFNPDQLVTRNEMAVVMSNLMDYRVSTYAGTSPFVDVPAWAEPYVAACWTNGITSGYTATTYGGSDSVTTAQAALMLMKALGYFQYASDFGDDWMLATVKQANKIDLFDDVDSGVREAMTRNDLAQLVLNTLEAGVVEATDDTIKVETGDVLVQGGSVTYSYVTSGKSYASAISDLGTYTSSAGTGGSTGYIVELGEKLYQGDLKKYEGVSDAFGRPATEWKYKVDEVGTFRDTPIATYTAKASKGTLYDLIGSSNLGKMGSSVVDYNATAGTVNQNHLTVYVDGAIVASTSASGNSGTNATTVAAYFDRNSSSGGDSGNGVITEVYQDDDNNVTIVYVDTYVAQATADYSEKKGSISVTVLTKPTDTRLDGRHSSFSFNTFNALEDDDFEDVKGLAEDDYILYTYSQKTGEVESIAKAQVVTGEVNAYSNKTGKTFGDAGGSVTIDGTKYSYAKFAEVDGSNGCATTFVVTDTAKIVTDGTYAYYVDDAAISVGNYVYINAIAPSTTLQTDIVAEAYFADGTKATIVLDEMKSGSTNMLSGLSGRKGATETANGVTVGGWYSYSKNSDGEYKLKRAVTNATFTNVVKNSQVMVGGAIAGNKDTVFVIKDKNDNISTYTGIANVPDVLATTTSDVKGWYMEEKDDGNKNIASLVFVDGTKATVKNSTDSLLYLLKHDSTTVDKVDGEEVYIWKVLLDGEETTISTKETWAKGDFFEDYSIDTDGYYEKGTKFDTTDSDKYIEGLGAEAITHSGSTLTVGNYSVVVNDDTEINLIMAPDTKGAAQLLSGTIMTDNNADYELGLKMKASTLANTFKGYVVDGKAFIIYNDANDNDLVDTVYVVVTKAYVGTYTPTTVAAGATNTNLSSDISGTTDVTLTQNVVVSGADINVVAGNVLEGNESKQIGSVALNQWVVGDDTHYVVLKFTAPTISGKTIDKAQFKILGGTTSETTADNGSYYLILGYNNADDVKVLTVNWKEASTGNILCSENFSITF